MMTWILDFVWTSYIGLHMLTGSLPENNYPKSSHIERLGNSWYTSNYSTSLNRNMILVTFTRRFFYKSKQFFGKCSCPVTLNCWTIKNDHNQTNFVDSIKSFCQQIFKVNFEQIRRHYLSNVCHVSFKMRISFVTLILSFLKPKKWKRAWGAGWVETQLQLQTQHLVQKTAHIQ